MKFTSLFLNGVRTRAGTISTAEPYSAVTQLSDLVVIENFVRKGTVGTIEEVDAKYELLQRGQYDLAKLRPGVRALVRREPLSWVKEPKC